MIILEPTELNKRFTESSCTMDPVAVLLRLRHSRRLRTKKIVNAVIEGSLKQSEWLQLSSI